MVKIVSLSSWYHWQVEARAFEAISTEKILEFRREMKKTGEEKERKKEKEHSY